MTIRAALACAVVALLAPARARGNGAFPDGLQVMLPADRAGTIAIGTNFGLVFTDDGGATWRWACEHDRGTSGARYQMSAAPRDRVFAMALDGFVWTDDLGCRWSSLPAPDLYIFDYFPDPTAAGRVLLLAARREQRLLVESEDGGATIARVLYTAPPFRELTTVEIARSDPRVVYLTLSSNDATEHDLIARSADGGATWSVRDPGAVTGGGNLWIAGVDRADPDRVYFRVKGTLADRLAVSEDGGRSLRQALTVKGQLTAFVQLGDGAVLTASLAGDEGHVQRSLDGGRSFAELPTSLRVRALGERDGAAYAVTDDRLDRGALAVSMDRGDTWTRVMSYADVRETASCNDLPATCAGICLTLVAQGALRPGVCGATADAGTAGSSGRGCSCGLARSREQGAGFALLAVVALLRRLLVTARR